jgi:hypothetical protein
MKSIAIIALLFAACQSHAPGALDMSTPRDSSVSDSGVAYLDLAKPDQYAPRDFSGLDLSCVRCNAVINPCPGLGLYCWPATGCCDTVQH